MNDKPLPPSHGFPVRLLAPGIAGARSVKWLDRITVQLTESQNYYQQSDYKVLPPQATSCELAKIYWPLCPAIQEMPVNSVVCSPAAGETVVLSKEKNLVEVRGYALPAGNHGPVTKVEVSADNGKTWTLATLVQGEDPTARKWAWTLWRAEVSLVPGEGRKIVSRATDRGGNVQPERAEWNFRGVMYNGWGEARGLRVVVGGMKGSVERRGSLENGSSNGHECVENGSANGVAK
jgi:sulfite oxidase